MKLNTTLVGIILSLLLLGCASQQLPNEEAPQEEEPQAGQPTPAQEPQLSIQPQENLSEEASANESLQEPEAQHIEETPPSITPPPNARCVDSDVTAEHPDGINFDVVGNVTINGKPIERGTDYCANLATISEWYCVGDIARVRTQKCSSGSCKNGVCV
jgi:hypothetical protein